MALTNVLRARVILDLVKDGVVATESNYSGAAVDKASAADAGKYGSAFWRCYLGTFPDGVHSASGTTPRITPTGQDERDATNEEIANHYLNMLRRHHKAVLETVRAPAAAETARATEIATVATEITTDLGSDT